MIAEKSSKRSFLSFLLPIGVIVLSLAFARVLSPLERLLASTVALFVSFKIAALVKHPGYTSIVYLIWPGIDPKPFQVAKEMPESDGARFGHGLIRFSFGFLALLIVAGFSPTLGLNVATWLAIMAILFAVHLGLSDTISGLVHAMGWKVQPLFDSPLRAKSLADFWSRRWNRPFVELDRIFFLPTLSRWFGKRKAIFGVFLVSGLLHEFAISYPAGAGWGGPLLYFILQASLLFVERRLRLKGPIWTFVAVFVPMPILFHGAFREACVWPLLETLSHLLHAVNLKVAVSYLALALASSQLLVLLASFQVPTRLGWKEDLPKLSPFNRKLMWTYGAFIVYTIVAWSVLTFTLRAEIVEGTRAALAVTLVIFLFWFSRLLTDGFYFRSEDWPKGPFMQIGHAMLNALFVFICGGYGCLVAWNLLA